MNLTTKSILVGMTLSLTACSSLIPNVGGDPETDTFRQALPAAEDVEMEYADNGGTTQQGLNGDRSLVAGLTASAIVGTNAHMIAHFAMMERVADMPPIEEGDDYRVWQGEHDDTIVRVRADRSETPRGNRYDYTVSAKLIGGNADFATVIDGHVVRLDEAYEPRDGFGIVRFHLDNFDPFEDGTQDGKVRVAFRKANKAHQVRVNAIGVKTADDPDFPKAAHYEYVVRPNESGALRWFSTGDVLKDDEPLEQVAVHSMWRADKSGIGSATVFGGSLQVDYWHLTECWDSTFIKGFDALDTPDGHVGSGDRETCFQTPDDLNVPEHQETLPDEDPEIPSALPSEEDAG